MILQLYNEGIRGKTLNLVWNILHNRTALVKVNDLNKSIPCTDTGACQGNSSAAVMFTFLIRKMMKNTSCNKIKYSDDGNLYISGLAFGLALVIKRVFTLVITLGRVREERDKYKKFFMEQKDS